MRKTFSMIATVTVSGVFSIVLLTGMGTFAAERPAAKSPGQPQPVKTPAKQVKTPAKQEVEIEVQKSVDGPHEDMWEKLTHLAVDMLSGNVAHLLSGNCPELLSGNKPKLISDNCPKLLSENATPILSGNRFSFFSDIKVEVNVHISNSGNKNKEGD